MSASTLRQRSGSLPGNRRPNPVPFCCSICLLLSPRLRLPDDKLGLAFDGFAGCGHYLRVWFTAHLSCADLPVAFLDFGQELFICAVLLLRAPYALPEFLRQFRTLPYREGQHC